MRITNFIVQLSIVFLITFTGCTGANNDIEYSSHEYELNIGNKGRMAVDGDFIYYSNVNDNYNLYRIDKSLKNKQKVYEGDVVGNITVVSDSVYFTERTWVEGQPEFSVCSIDKKDESYGVVLNDVISFAFLNGKLYYYKDSGEVSGDPVQYPLAFFCSYDLASKEEQIIDEKIILVLPPVAYDNKIYYRGSDYIFIEYDPLTSEKREIDMEINYFCRFYNGNIISYKGNIIERTNISENAKQDVLSGMDEIYNIWDMNVTEDYIFFLAEETEEVYSGINRLHLFRIKHDGSEITKIYTTDYKTNLTSARQLIYCLGDKLVLYDYEMTEDVVNRGPVLVIDFNGNEIKSDF